MSLELLERKFEREEWRRGLWDTYIGRERAFDSCSEEGEESLISNSTAGRQVCTACPYYTGLFELGSGVGLASDCDEGEVF